MTTRASKKTITTSMSTSSIGTPQGISTPQAGTSGRPGSPLSPTRYSRLQEKADLQNLNDRLACYIDKVRQLESENSTLRREVLTSQETITREVTSLKSMYEHELADARKLLDETAREKAKLEIDSKRLWEDNDMLKAKLDKKTKELSYAEKSILLNESRISDLTTKYNQVASDRAKIKEELKELDKEAEILRKQVEDLRKHLGDETLARIDLENNLQSVREDLSFKEQLYKQELTEITTKQQTEFSEIDGRLTEQYEARMQVTLQELREQYESQMRTNREEIEMLYETKIKNLTNQAQRNSGAASAAIDELRMFRSRVDDMNSRISELESTNASLQARIRDLENLLDGERIRHNEERSSLEAELQVLRDEMATQLQEYQDLMDIKVALDLEIAAYRKLLESEEARLNISPMASPGTYVPSRAPPPMRRTPMRGGKRKRTMEESEESSSSNYQISSKAKSDVEITEVCPDGKFVKLFNKGNKDIALGGWQLVRRVGEEEVTFKFHRSVKIDAGGHITVWSSDAGQTHDPPGNLVMKSQKWFVGDSMVTKLINNTGEEMAVMERRRQQLSTSISRHRESGFVEQSKEEVFHQIRPQGGLFSWIPPLTRP